jgi:hypothetical protein
MEWRVSWIRVLDNRDAAGLGSSVGVYGESLARVGRLDDQ